jgi:formylglycine-generating enzyme required for sulfatase activity
MIASLLLLATLTTAPAVADPPCLDADRMAFVPAGRFWMGSDRTERTLAASLAARADWLRAERPRQRVSLPAYCIDRFLVTHAEYAAFVTATRHPRPAAGPGPSLRPDRKPEESDQQVARYLWHRGEPPDSRSQHPVVLVRAAGAEAYCRWRHFSFRLPTEAQWERAARGDGGWVFPWGNRWSANRLNSAGSGHRGTTAIDRYPAGASSHGMFDAVGNVYQWTATALDANRRVVKGCAWDDPPGACRPARRLARDADSPDILLGFRCAAPPADP